MGKSRCTLNFLISTPIPLNPVGTERAERHALDGSVPLDLQHQFSTLNLLALEHPGLKIDDRKLDDRLELELRRTTIRTALLRWVIRHPRISGNIDANCPLGSLAENPRTTT